MSKSNQLQHLAIIMDGNGRWAKQRGLARTKGHEKGAEVVREITTFCSNIDEIKTLTLYAFSTENWKRPKMEVNFLMKLLEKYLNNELETYMQNGVRFETIGNLEPFSKGLKKAIKNLKEATKNNSKLTQIIALNYGAQDEIVRAVNSLISSKQEVTIDSLSSALDTPYSDVDLLIRTSGELRLSNYLLWQIAYSELYFSNTLWPDFTPNELEEIIKNYKTRERKFGGI
jgi:undecaprenyl diphosphate synthase